MAKLPDKSPISPDPDKIDPVAGRGQTQPENPEAFKEHMKSGATDNVQKSNAPSPMDIANTTKAAGAPPTMRSVQDQMSAVSGTLGDIKTKLHTKGLKLKASEKYLVRKKLNNAGEHLSGAAKQSGADSGSYTSKLGRSKNPIARFLAMVSDGQHQMVQAAGAIKSLNATGKSISAGKLLLVQIKLNKAQQELNYTSVILGSATSMIKTLFSIQI